MCRGVLQKSQFCFSGVNGFKSCGSSDDNYLGSERGEPSSPCLMKVSRTLVEVGELWCKLPADNIHNRYEPNILKHFHENMTGESTVVEDLVTDGENFKQRQILQTSVGVWGLLRPMVRSSRLWWGSPDARHWTDVETDVETDGQNVGARLGESQDRLGEL
jgi:hypothetical protein